MKHFMINVCTFCAAAVLAAPPLAGSAATSDSSFVTKAAQGGMAEVKAAKIALQKSKNPTVDEFARKMIADHMPNNKQLISIVKSEGLTPPGSVGAMHEAELSKLRMTSSASFDSVYLAGQVADHEKMLALMRNEASSGTDPKLVQFAKATAPVVEQHLGLARKDASANS